MQFMFCHVDVVHASSSWMSSIVRLSTDVEENLPFKVKKYFRGLPQVCSSPETRSKLFLNALWAIVESANLSSASDFVTSKRAEPLFSLDLKRALPGSSTFRSRRSKTVPVEGSSDKSKSYLERILSIVLEQNELFSFFNDAKMRMSKLEQEIQSV